MRRGLTQLRRAVAIATVLLSASAGTGIPAFATNSAQGTTSTTITSGTWRAAPSATSFTFATGSLSAPQYVTITNSGTLSLVGSTYSTAITSGSGTVSAKSCSVAWNTTLNVCVGTTTTLVTTANSPQSAAGLNQFPATASSSITLQLSDAGGVGSVTASFAVSVTRAQARAATTTNS